jgi:hypothetical protein
MRDWIAWKPLPRGSASGCRNAMSRSRRYCADHTQAESVGTRRSAEPRNQRSGQPGEEEHRAGDHEVREGRPEVGLEEDEARRSTDDEPEDRQERPRRMV